MSEQPQTPFWAVAGAFMAGFAVRELVAKPQTQAYVRKQLMRVSPKAQTTIEKWMRHGHQVMVEQGTEHLIVYVRTAAGKVSEVKLKYTDPDVIDV